MASATDWITAIATLLLAFTAIITWIGTLKFFHHSKENDEEIRELQNRVRKLEERAQTHSGAFESTSNVLEILAEADES